MADFTTTNRPYVLLTGASGLVGGMVLARLLNVDLPVAVVVRGNRKQSPVQRIESLMQGLEERFDRLFTRPVVLHGDLVLPEMGLSQKDQSWIAQNCNSVIHSAANLLFRPAADHPDNEPYRTNVDGTRHLLDLMTKCQISEWHYVSTAYIAGLRANRILETESDVGQDFGNDYERSKLICEQMLKQSASIRSLTIYRPSIVIDLLQKSSIRADKTIDIAFSMFKTLSQRFGLPERGDWFQRLGFGGSERKNIVTVDWVSEMIAQIYRRPSLHGKTYHLTSPTGTSVSELEDGFRSAVIQAGVKLPDSRIEVPALFNEQAAPFVAAFKPYFKDDPIFDRSNTIDAMKACASADLPKLTAEELGQFYSEQAQAASPTITDSPATSVWELFATRSANSVTKAPQSMKSSSEEIVLQLLGPGGGEWTLRESLNGWITEAGNSGSASTRAILTTESMDRLINGLLLIDQAIESGLVVIETDARVAITAHGDATPSSLGTSMAELLIERLARLVSTLHQFNLHHAHGSEVISVH